MEIIRNMAPALKLIPTGTAQIPTLRSISPEVDRLEKLQTSLGDKREALNKERIKLIEELHGTSNRYHPQRDEPLSQQSIAVAAMLGDPPPLPKAEPVTNTGIHRLQEISDELKVLEIAERELSRRLIAAQRVASITVCDQVRDQHAALAAQLLQALKAVHQANIQYTEFAEKMIAEKISWHDLNPILPHFLGEPTNLYAPLAQYFMEAERSGWIKATDMPKEFRQ